MLEMSPYFSDPDGDTLTYAATASRAGIFDVAATGGAVTLEALARGAATITVTATDPGGLAATQSFQATVPNRAPEARGEIPAATLEVGDTLMLEMSPYFSDPDGDTLTYAATASRAGIFDVAATGGAVTLEALARGAATIAVTATDPGGLAASQSFTATVANRAPAARGEIPAATLEAGDTLMLEMSPYFSDPDGDTLTYAATASQERAYSTLRPPAARSPSRHWPAAPPPSRSRPPTPAASRPRSPSRPPSPTGRPRRGAKSPRPPSKSATPSCWRCRPTSATRTGTR